MVPIYCQICTSNINIACAEKDEKGPYDLQSGSWTLILLSFVLVSSVFEATSFVHVSKPWAFGDNFVGSYSCMFIWCSIWLVSITEKCVGYFWKRLKENNHLF